MEAVFAWDSLSDFVFRLSACVEVGVDCGDLVEDVLGLVSSLNLPFAVVRFEGVGFDDEEGVIIISRYLGGFPCEAVDVAVAVPLGDDCGASAFDHVEAIEDDDY